MAGRARPAGGAPVSPNRRWWGGLAVAAVVGAILRCWNLGSQILAGDELHAVRAALSDPVAVLLTTYRQADPCLPLAAFYRFLMDRGIPLSETWLRAPVLASGLAVIVVLPWLARRIVGDRAALLLVWLLALSPSMVLFGRIVRPYAPVVLLGGVAVLGFYRWWSGGGRGGAVAYALLAPLAVYFHLGAAPLVAAPIVFAAADGALRREARRRWLELASVAVVALGLLFALLLPARTSLLEVLAQKGGASSWSWSIVPPVLELLAGTPRPWVAAVVWLLAVAGWILLARRHARFAAYSGVLVAAQVTGLWALAPFGVFSPLIVERYLLVAWPLVALWVAAALAAAWPATCPATALASLPGAAPDSWPWRRWAALAGSVVLLAGVFLAGPLATGEFGASSFVHHDDFLSFDRPTAHLATPSSDEALADVYRRLAPSDPAAAEGALIEYPFRPVWRFARAPYLYQRWHRRRVLVSTLEPPLCDPRLDLATHVCPRPASFLDAPARFLVVHLDLEHEEEAVTGVRKALDVRRPRRWQIHREAALRMARTLRQRWGAPDLEGGGVLVWDLDRVRQERGLPRLGIE